MRAASGPRRRAFRRRPRSLDCHGDGALMGAWAAKREARMRAGDPAVPHGTIDAYRNWKCRCELCVIVKSMDAALRRARPKLRTGCPLSSYERETLESELAYREGRQLWYMTPDG